VCTELYGNCGIGCTGLQFCYSVNQENFFFKKFAAGCIDKNIPILLCEKDFVDYVNNENMLHRNFDR